MDFFRAPKPAVPFFSQRVVLDGVEYILDIEWNQRKGWFFSLADAATEEPLITGKRMVVDWPLLYGCTDERKPPGVLMLIDASGQSRSAGYDDLDERCLIAYIPYDEAVELYGAPPR